MMDHYLSLLYKQYCDARGVEYILYGEYEDKDFLAWTKSLVKDTKEYLNYLDYIGVDLYPETTIEVNKGLYDTLGESNVTIVSPFGSTLGHKEEVLKVREEGPIIIPYYTEVPSEYSLFTTHNPYFLSEDATNFVRLARDDRSICLGMYGNKYDEDSKTKIEILTGIHSFIGDRAEFHYDTFNDSYFGILLTRPKIKEKIKTRTMDRSR